MLIRADELVTCSYQNMIARAVQREPKWDHLTQLARQKGKETISIETLPGIKIQILDLFERKKLYKNLILN